MGGRSEAVSLHVHEPKIESLGWIIALCTFDQVLKSQSSCLSVNPKALYCFLKYNWHFLCTIEVNSMTDISISCQSISLNSEWNLDQSSYNSIRRLMLTCRGPDL